jgi:hypothetical protein
MKKRTAFVVLLLLSACAPIEHVQSFSQPIGQTLMAGPGDVVARVDKHRDLENLFGKADLYGRKTNEGYSELRYAGIEKNGTIVLFRKDVAIISNETTMSRSPFTSTFAESNTTSTATVSGSTYGNQFQGSGVVNSNTRASAVTIRPTSDYHVVVPPDTIAIRVPKGTTQFPFEGKLVQIITANSASLSYRISDMQQ